MGKFDKYFLMNEKDVEEYVLLKTSDCIAWDKETIKAIVPEEHGNLNYVFHVSDGKGNSIYVKQAGLETRISKDMKATLDRNRLESELLMLEDRLAPGMVPKVYFYDTEMSACGMEDCSDYYVMRNAMLEHRIYKEFADEISTFMARTLLLTSDIVMDHREKKELQKDFISPDLCDITEKLVLMEPYGDHMERNRVTPTNMEFVEKELYSDESLKLEVAKLKYNFMTNAQSLLHGDLHTGSIFIKEGSLKVFDCEFGTYAPAGYDIGNVIANLIFAYVNGLAYGDNRFCEWILESIKDTVDLFVDKWEELYDIKVTEPMAKTPGFKNWYLGEILRDTAGYTGTELHRRTVGLAGVADIESIEDEHERILAERICIIAGKNFILNQKKYTCGEDYVKAIEKAVKKARKSI